MDSIFRDDNRWALIRFHYEGDTRVHERVRTFDTNWEDEAGGWRGEWITGQPLLIEPRVCL